MASRCIRHTLFTHTHTHPPTPHDPNPIPPSTTPSSWNPAPPTGTLRSLASGRSFGIALHTIRHKQFIQTNTPAPLLSRFSWIVCLVGPTGSATAAHRAAEARPHRHTQISQPSKINARTQHDTIQQEGSVIWRVCSHLFSRVGVGGLDGICSQREWATSDRTDHTLYAHAHCVKRHLCMLPHLVLIVLMAVVSFSPSRVPTPNLPSAPHRRLTADSPRPNSPSHYTTHAHCNFYQRR